MPAAPWQELLLRLEEGRSWDVALEVALSQPGLASWLLERLEQADFPPTAQRGLGWLLRGLLTVWDRLPYDPPVDRADFLRRAIQAGSVRESPAAVLALAWRGQRFLGAEHREIVEGARPQVVDGWEAGQEGVNRAHMFLALLDDVLRSLAEREWWEVFQPYLSDPSFRVRALAFRIYFSCPRSGGWQAALDSLDRLDAEGRRQVLLQIAQDLEPRQAAELMTRICKGYPGEGPYLGAWINLSLRSSEAVGEALLQDLHAEIYRPEYQNLLLPGHPRASKQAAELVSLGRFRMELMDAYLAATYAGQAFDPQIFARVAQEDWNPICRKTAWGGLALSDSAEARRLALLMLAEPGYAQSLRPSDSTDDALLYDGIKNLALSLESAELQSLRLLAEGMRFRPEQRQELAGIFAGH